MWYEIDAVMQKQGLTIAELARKAGYSNATTLYAIRSGQIKDPGFSTVIRIADALGIKTDDLRPKGGIKSGLDRRTK